MCQCWNVSFCSSNRRTAISHFFRDLRERPEKPVVPVKEAKEDDERCFECRMRLNDPDLKMHHGDSDEAVGEIFVATVINIRRLFSLLSTANDVLTLCFTLASRDLCDEKNVDCLCQIEECFALCNDALNIFTGEEEYSDDRPSHRLTQFRY